MSTGSNVRFGAVRALVGFLLILSSLADVVCMVWLAVNDRKMSVDFETGMSAVAVVLFLWVVRLLSMMRMTLFLL